VPFPEFSDKAQRAMSYGQIDQGLQTQNSPDSLQVNLQPHNPVGVPGVRMVALSLSQLVKAVAVKMEAVVGVGPIRPVGIMGDHHLD